MITTHPLHSLSTCFQLVEKSYKNATFITMLPCLLQHQYPEFSSHWIWVCLPRKIFTACCFKFHPQSTATRYCKWFWKGLWLHSSVPSSAKLSPNSDSHWRSNWWNKTNNQDILGYSVPMVWHVVWQLWTRYSIWPSVAIKQQRKVCIYIWTMKLYSRIHFIYVFFTFQHI